MAANPIQYLKHGKALCGKVFKTFVETFNWHTNFCLNLKGDGDLTGSTGQIILDRSDPDHPVIRFRGIGNVSNRQSDRQSDRLWHFTCEEDPESGERVGGWKNCKVQIGYSLAHMDETNKEKFSGFDQTEDGVYYIDVDLVNESVELKRVDFNDDESSSFEIPPSDLKNAHVNMEVGAVKDGVEAWSINWVPVIYKFI